MLRSLFYLLLMASLGHIFSSCMERVKEGAELNDRRTATMYAEASTLWEYNLLCLALTEISSAFCSSSMQWMVKLARKMLMRTRWIYGNGALKKQVSL